MRGAAGAATNDRLDNNHRSTGSMAFNLSLAAMAIAVIAQAPPGADVTASGAEAGSFVALADELDVVKVEAPPAATAENSSGIPEPGAWSMVLMGLGVVALFATRSRR
jgi:hypothetical protein